MHTWNRQESFDTDGAAGFTTDIDIGAGIGAVVSHNSFDYSVKIGGGHSKISEFSSVVASSTHHDVSFTFTYDFSTSDDPNIAGHPSDIIVGGGVDLIVTEGFKGE